MSAHTPGPWQTSGVRIKIDGQPFLQVDAPNGTGIVAYVPYSDRRPADHVQSHADQRLIAATPIMLAGLIAIRDGTISGKVGGEDVVWFDGITTLHDFCDEIIAKATGAA